MALFLLSLALIFVLGAVYFAGFTRLLLLGRLIDDE